MDVYINSEIGVCQEFIEENKVKKEAVSIVISPLKIIYDESGMNLRVINGCNMWQACANSKCFYSRAARSQPKVRTQDK